MNQRTDGGADRLAALCRSIALLVASTDRFERVAREDGAGSPGCSARFTSTKGSVATLVLTDQSVTVTTDSAADHPDAGRSETVDVLGVDLRTGYRWDDVECSSSDQLADLLLKHMYRRTHEAAPEPGEDS